MAITVGQASFSALTAQPYAYQENDTTRGLTAKKYIVSGLMTPSEWLALLEAYDTWRDLRIQDLDPSKSYEVGTTITVEGVGPDSSTWEAECWFLTAPKGEQVGNKISVSVEVVDAAESIEILAKEVEDEDDPGVDLGTVTIGSPTAGTATIKLLQPMESYAEPPTLDLTATGNYYVSGPLVVRPIRNIEGTTSATDWAIIQVWYEEEVIKIPTTGTWYPLTAPTATAKSKLVAGIKVIEYTVSLQLAYII